PPIVTPSGTRAANVRRLEPEESQMALTRRAAWLTIPVTALRIMDVQWLTALFGVAAEGGLLSGFCDAGFLQSLQWLRAMKLLTELLCAGTPLSGPAAASLRR